MSDTQPENSLSPEQQLELRIESLKSTHAQFVNLYQQKQSELENIVTSIRKIEGAIESLADFKSAAYGSQPAPSPESNEASEEILEAEYKDTELVN